jgi:hypothetical protein
VQADLPCGMRSIFNWGGFQYVPGEQIAGDSMNQGCSMPLNDKGHMKPKNWACLQANSGEKHRNFVKILKTEKMNGKNY